MDRPAWKNLIFEILDDFDHEQFYMATTVARTLGLDVSAMVFEKIKADPVEYACYCPVIYANAEYAKQLTELYEKTLPLSDLAAGKGDDLLYDMSDLCLRFVLPELKNYPKMGERLIQTALGFPEIGVRNRACDVLEEWAKALEKPVRKISPELYATLKRTASYEIDDGIKARMKKLLIGKPLFD